MNNNVLKGSVCIYTLGCAKNEVDSQQMRDRLRDAGYSIVDNADLANVVIVNTCSFIQAATEESIDAVLEACSLPGIDEGRCAVIVSGCMPARYGEQLQTELPEPFAFVSCAEEQNIVQVVDAAMKSLNNAHQYSANACLEAPCAHMPYAYVKISDGCDRFCSYCTIPFIRGRYRSFPLEDIENDVEKAIQNGAKEIILIAQDTGRWGADLEDGCSLAWLLRSLANRFTDTWFRVMYIQPDGVTDELLDTIADCKNVAKYLDIPLQHVDPTILKAMNRTGSLDTFLALAQKARNRIDEVTLRTTLIAGFPGETEEQFEMLVNFAASGCFDYVGVFPYSQEEGTRAASMADQLDEDEKMYRAQKVQDAADAAGAAAVSARIGSVQNVLIEGVEEDGQLYGRTMQQAPEVDGITFVDSGNVGDIVAVSIDDTLLYDMEGATINV
ncbi:30S ribosomal protein S12 methylthiotransferase RimO [Adlercreutzia sp. ZJ154]|uniref:30S ribosomal protein S12 methylthiotransferase RimO n=1 Tax=Adlercreutzia sp. ZJ154 TaxID=2709790 RepID=UPI0013EB20B0|nr:30S ribosomal protein S12 methylthiotransferase RimO [Adlercreutzia sp. ZJ154]